MFTEKESKYHGSGSRELNQGQRAKGSKCDASSSSMQQLTVCVCVWGGVKQVKKQSSHSQCVAPVLGLSCKKNTTRFFYVANCGRVRRPTTYTSSPLLYVCSGFKNCLTDSDSP
jgi:hypothetical protein